MKRRSKMAMITNDYEETANLGLLLGSVCRPGSIILLNGDLGTGKPCLTQGLARGLGVESPVTSPTFVLIAEHKGRLPLYHMDLYRLADGLVQFDLGLDEYFYGDGVTVVEWPEYGGEAIPDEYIHFRFEHIAPEQREIHCTLFGETFHEVFADFYTAVSSNARHLLLT